MANRSSDRLKPKLAGGKPLGNLRLFPLKSNPRFFDILTSDLGETGQQPAGGS
jgi:hypothetical protein